MPAKKTRRSQKTQAPNAPRFVIVALANMTNMLAVTTTSVMLLGGFLLVRNFG